MAAVLVPGGAREAVEQHYRCSTSPSLLNWSVLQWGQHQAGAQQQEGLHQVCFTPDFKLSSQALK